MQDLSSEQARSQKLTAEVDRLSQRVQRSEAELKATTDSLNQTQQRAESLSQHLRRSEALLHLEKSQATTKVKSVSNSEFSGTQEAPPPDQSPEPGRDRALSVTLHHSSGELDRQLNERVTELEKEVCIIV